MWVIKRRVDEDLDYFFYTISWLYLQRISYSKSNFNMVDSIYLIFFKLRNAFCIYIHLKHERNFVSFVLWQSGIDVGLFDRLFRLIHRNNLYLGICGKTFYFVIEMEWVELNPEWNKTLEKASHVRKCETKYKRIVIVYKGENNPENYSGVLSRLPRWDSPTAPNEKVRIINLTFEDFWDMK